MQNESDWVLGLLQEYKRVTHSTPLFISDWDTLNEQAEYPFQFIRKALDIAPEKTLTYSFSDEQEEIKNLIIAKLINVQSLSVNNLAISISATAAIYLSLLALYRSGLKHFVVLTPVYYSIVETLAEQGLEVHYFHLTDANAFEIDLLKLEELIIETRAEVLAINDPIYCVGKKLAAETLVQLVDLCNRNHCLIFLDNTLGGLDWAGLDPQIIEENKLLVLSKAHRFLMIDSLTKKLLVNGLKHAVVFANENLITLIEDIASRVYGGFSFPQLQFMTELYQESSSIELNGILKDNAQLIRNNYQLLTAFLSDKPFKLYAAQSGYFTMIAHERYLCCEVDIRSQVTGYLYDLNTFLLPPWYFNFSASNHFGLRVNLLKDASVYLSALDECIRKKVKLLH